MLIFSVSVNSHPDNIYISVYYSRLMAMIAFIIIW
jgi:hypothetical protein